MMRTFLLVSGLVALSLLSSGCGKNSEDSATPATTAIPQPRPLSEKKPLDHVEPGALLEGSEKVYALPLPYGFHISARTGRMTRSYGQAPARQVAAYVQTRVRDGSLVEKEGTYLFSSVRLPAEPDRLLNIEIDHVRDSDAQVLVTDITPPPDMGAANPLPADRFKQAGLDSKGHILDPSRLE